MTIHPTHTILIVPGLRDHVEDHWQTLLERRLPNARSVPPLTHDKLNRAARVAALDAALARIDGPVVLVAHSAGVMIAAHWAQRHPQHSHRIRGALLATPPNFDAPLPPGYPTPDTLRKNGWLPTPRIPLGFPSIVAASTNDPLARMEHVAELAKAWGSRLVDIGAAGHLNPASGYGEWPLADELIAGLCLERPHQAA
ncbi:MULTISPECIES: alpha/beta hydrolase [unclassified Caballeronia]|uniref:RBBP9/YdeN family alpha/beta hydrolase n=1 Tax=unclassified Caballeronia TaxID=2646786 RepID=UPI00286710CA|nr:MULTISPECIES: alpha/beta hydrolase [unclassified Caballeronia]MDR5741010.1 alpha/beta fold hydrolase [Caballeronia sp. LZ016]MDR5806909.1 alpha/beta fold hydrolase [Caballeronia sp. LZ019]